MTDLERLQLLKVVALDAEIDTCPGMGKLANDLESLRSMLEVVSERFKTSFSVFWAALEVVAVQHQEDGCSGSMIPDTNVGGKITTINEVSDDQKATFFFS